METYQTAKFDRSPNNLSWDIVLTDRWPEKKKNKKSKNNRSAFACRSKNLTVINVAGFFKATKLRLLVHVVGLLWLHGLCHNGIHYVIEKLHLDRILSSLTIIRFNKTIIHGVWIARRGRRIYYGMSLEMVATGHEKFLKGYQLLDCGNPEPTNCSRNVIDLLKEVPHCAHPELRPLQNKGQRLAVPKRHFQFIEVQRYS